MPIVSHLFFVGFLLLSVDVGDSTGGITILVALQFLGVDEEWRLPDLFYGKSGAFIDLFQCVAFIILDIIILIMLKKMNAALSKPD